MQLRARHGRAVLAEDDLEFGISDGEQGEPDDIELDADLARALHEWARVAEAVVRADSAEGAAGGLISRRGRQLAGRLAASMGVALSYLDPVTGEVVQIGEPDEWPQLRAARTRLAGAHAAPAPPRPHEVRRAVRTPWATGLTVSGFAALIALFAVIALSSALGVASDWLATAANVIIALGLAPSLWLTRNVPVWRWVSYGVVAGIGMAWLALLFTLA